MNFRWIAAFLFSCIFFSHSHSVSCQGVQVLPNLVEKRVDVFIDGKLFTSYRFSDELKKPSFFPILSSEARSLHTEPIGGKRFELPFHPEIGQGSGKEPKLPETSIVHKSLDSYKSGENQGEMTVTSEWKNSKGKTVITEKTVYLFERKDGARFINRKTTLLAGKDTIRFEEDTEPKVASQWINMRSLQGTDSTRLTFFQDTEKKGFEAENSPIRAKTDPSKEAKAHEIKLYLPPGKTINFNHRIVVWMGEIPDHETIMKYYDEWTK